MVAAVQVAMLASEPCLVVAVVASGLLSIETLDDCFNLPLHGIWYGSRFILLACHVLFLLMT
jgi:hypothetical protein